MRLKVKMQKFGMNMTEATITEWLKKPGEAFAPGDGLYSIETEKVTQEVEATAHGTLVEILVPEGEDAEVGQPVCIVEVEG